MILWAKDGPVCGQDSDKDIVSFVDKYATCKKDKDIAGLVNYQTHRHTKTCRQTGKSICRFSFPIPPFPYTVVLEPLSSISSDDKKKYLEKYDQIVTALNSLYKEDINLPFECFLQ